MANGEESLVDLNGNGVYDPGEPFIDMGEPCVDVNENGQWDPGEPFFDTERQLGRGYGETAPCYVVTNVLECPLPSRTACSGFSYWVVGQAVITGACSNAPVSDTVTATVNGVSTGLTVSGTCTP
jgi:hypothetical protein